MRHRIIEAAVSLVALAALVPMLAAAQTPDPMAPIVTEAIRNNLGEAGRPRAPKRDDTPVGPRAVKLRVPVTRAAPRADREAVRTAIPFSQMEASPSDSHLRNF
jgi:hypothetical protein